MDVSIYLAEMLKENEWALAEISLNLLVLGDFISCSPLSFLCFLSQIVLVEKSL